ncbi:hypothetical protein [Larsenimonas suaedae]|uniref:Uncharacterized protein n=1 Tax=Larsenimonas suaedae TaxID=1851019 RepID=A0ABU1GR20_9GAMM|nr:hypothetical protein [Larsenimonas suaedae]MCM2972731.1 hypothetical protein [Larsenimonas suaedae]MDR5894472.1 hypothetical protein [Larsenimonas suaedae]
MSMRTIEWDSPEHEGVTEHYDDLYFLKKKPSEGSIVTARYKSTNVRLKVVERQGDSTSVAEVISVNSTDATNNGVDLHVGEHVLLPDDKRAFVSGSDEDE